MFDIGISEFGLIGAVALVVLGPEKLPRVARTVGTLLGRAQRYLADVKSEVSRQMDIDELRRMKETVQTSVQDVQSAVAKNLDEVNHEFEAAWSDVTAGLRAPTPQPGERHGAYLDPAGRARRLKPRASQAVPVWYRRQQGRARNRALSTAAARKRARGG
jgi:sec-independent protein translocase protein TatB